MIKKEMIYFFDEEAFTQPREILAEDNIDGYEYIVLSYGMYPAIYINLPIESKIVKIPLWRDMIRTLDLIHDFHGGVTDCTPNLDTGERELRTGYFVGWAYNTDEDFIAGKYFLNHAGGRRWTTAQLVREAEAAIESLKVYEEQK